MVFSESQIFEGPERDCGPGPTRAGQHHQQRRVRQRTDGAGGAAVAVRDSGDQDTGPSNALLHAPYLAYKALFSVHGHFAYKAQTNTATLHIKHYKTRTLCI